MNKAIRNYSFNLLYEFFLLIIPIAVTPYVARVLKESGSGQYSYAFSINNYFVLFASLGFSIYAQRIIAAHQNDEHKQSVDFWEIFFARLISSCIVLFIYTIIISLDLYDEKYRKLMLILAVNIFSVIFDINYFFQGNEEFDKIIIRNIIVRSITIFCIFLFVKSKNDLYKYALIQSSGTLFSNLSMWLYMPKYLKKISIKALNPFYHMKGALILFIPAIAISVYTSLDKIMIGVITKSDVENGNYEYAEKILRMILTIITSLGTVMSPRNSNRFAEGDIKAVEKNVYYTLQFVFFLGVPLMFGIIAIADNFVPWYLGDGYNEVASLIKILSPIIIIVGLSNVFGRQLLIPCKQENDYTISVVFGAIINFALNIILIKNYKSYGAAVATVITEMIVTTAMFFFVRTKIHLKILIFNSWKYWFSSIAMFAICKLSLLRLPYGILYTGITVMMGIVCYFIILFSLKDRFFYFLLSKFGFYSLTQ